MANKTKAELASELEEITRKYETLSKTLTHETMQHHKAKDSLAQLQEYVQAQVAEKNQLKDDLLANKKQVDNLVKQLQMYEANTTLLLAAHQREVFASQRLQHMEQQLMQTTNTQTATGAAK